MNNQVKENNQSSKKMKLFKFTSIAAIVATLAWVVSIVFVSGWVDIHEDLYAKTFMAWRSKGGDAALFTGRYKGYSKNDLPTNPKITNFLKIAQEEEALLLTGNYPLHAPREPENLWTLADDAVFDFWRIEFAVKARLNNKTDINAWKEEAKEAFEKKKYEKDFKPKWFNEDTTITGEELRDMFKASTSFEGNAVASAYMNIVNNLVNQIDNYGYIKNSVTDSFFMDIKALASSVGYDNLSKETINKFFFNMATVRASPVETFTYSRLFNMWVFLTINHNYKYSSNPKIAGLYKEMTALKTAQTNFGNETSPESTANKKKIGRKQSEIWEAESKEKASLFAQIFAKVYPKPYDYELKNESTKDYLVRVLGTSQDVSKVVKQDDVIESALSTARENVEIMNQ